jgi:hypothetical protein
MPELSPEPISVSRTPVADHDFIDLPSLAGILSLPALTSAEQLFIDGNPALAAVRLPALTKVVRSAQRATPTSSPWTPLRC